MGKNLRGGYKLISMLISLAVGSVIISGVYDAITSTKKRIVLTGLKIDGQIQKDISVEVDKADDGLHISNVYGYDLLIASNDSITISEHKVLSVIANPTLAGTEASLTGLEVDGTKYKVPEAGSQVVANPTLAGTEASLTGLEVDGTKYKVPESLKLYLHTIAVNDESEIFPKISLLCLSTISTPATDTASLITVLQHGLTVGKGTNLGVSVSVQSQPYLIDVWACEETTPFTMSKKTVSLSGTMQFLRDDVTEL